MDFRHACHIPQQLLGVVVCELRDGDGEWHLVGNPELLATSEEELHLYKGTRGQWSVVSGQWSVVNGQWSVVRGQWSGVRGQWSVVSGLWSVVRGPWSVVGGQGYVVSGQWSAVSGQWPVVSCLQQEELDLGRAAQDVGDELDKPLGRRQLITRVDE